MDVVGGDYWLGLSISGGLFIGVVFATFHRWSRFVRFMQGGFASLFLFTNERHQSQNERAISETFKSSFVSGVAGKDEKESMNDENKEISLRANHY